jgi:hypothetical protein
MVIIFAMAGCVRRYTRFESRMEQLQCSEITGITGIVNKDYASGKVSMDLHIYWCYSFGRNNCCNKEIDDDSMEVALKIGGQALRFVSETEGTYRFNPSDNSVFKQNDEAEVFVTYAVDSMGVRMTRKVSQILYKDTSWGYSVH